MTRGTIDPAAWRARGREVDACAGRVFVVELGAAPAQERLPALVLHGFPTSSWDFAECAELLAKDRRVVLFDFLGFGFSDKPHDMAYSLFEQADVATIVARACGLRLVHLFAHDMGTSVTTELLARRERGLLPFEVASVTLMNGSVHLDLARPTIGQRILRTPVGPAFARLMRRRVFIAQIRRVFAKPPPDEVLEHMWELLARCDGVLRMAKAIRYMDERETFARRWIGSLERLDVPALVAWATKDPVAVLAIGEQLAKETPTARLVTWEGLGHYPQVEDPALVAKTVGEFFARVEAG